MSYLYERTYFRLRRKSLRKKGRRLPILGKGLRRALAEDSAGDDGAVLKNLFKVLEKTGNGALRQLPGAWWNGYLRAVRAPRACFEVEEAQLLDVCQTLDHDALNAAAWLELYRLCLISGLFKVGLEIRRRAESECLGLASPGADLCSLRLALAVTLEQGAWAEALALLDGLNQAGEAEAALAHARWLVQTLRLGEIKPFPGDRGRTGTERALLWKVEARRVALVGPVASKLESGPEIDGFDMVAKFNYRGGELGCDAINQGRRVDVAYYNIDQSKYIARKMSFSFLAELAFPVFIKNKGFRVLKHIASNGRVLRNLQWLLLDSEFNAGPNAVYDLLRFAPGELKVFNSDLMLTAGRFAGYWQPGAREVNYCYSFAVTHDPVIQFRYLQHAWKSGLIAGDEQFRAVMDMTLEEYIDNLQAAHGQIGREGLCDLARR